MKNELMNKIGNAVNKTKFTIVKHSPEILMVTGIVGVVTTTILACKATLEVGEVLDQHAGKIDEIKSAEITEEHTEEDQKKEVAVQYTQTAFVVVKKYAPSIIIGVFSIGCLIGSNRILNKRNASLAAAYAAVDRGFKEYRQRVVERFGKEVDHQLKYNLKDGQIEEETVDDKGKLKKVKKDVDVIDSDVVTSDYARVFNSSNPYWNLEAGHGDSSFVEMFFNHNQSYLNNRLKADGIVTLNQVYKALGFHETKAGMVVGWRYDENRPSGDNYIQFDVHPVYKENEFGEKERMWIIDFNVDGNIYNEVDDIII